MNGLNLRGCGGVRRGHKIIALDRFVYLGSEILES